MTDAQRLPSPDDPFWTEAPLRDLFAPPTSERIKRSVTWFGSHSESANVGNKNAASKSAARRLKKKGRPALTPEKKVVGA